MAEGVKRATISLAAGLMEAAEKRVETLGYRTFSEYVAFLIASDVKARPVHSTVRGEKGVLYSQSQSQHQTMRLNENPPKG